MGLQALWRSFYLQKEYLFRLKWVQNKSYILNVLIQFLSIQPFLKIALQRSWRIPSGKIRLPRDEEVFSPFGGKVESLRVGKNPLRGKNKENQPNY